MFSNVAPLNLYRGGRQLRGGLLVALLPVGGHRLLVVVPLEVLLPLEVVPKRLELVERLYNFKQFQEKSQKRISEKRLELVERLFGHEPAAQIR